MALTGFGKGLWDGLQNAAQSAKEAVEGIDLADVKDKLQDAAQSAAQSAKEAVESIDLEDVKEKLQETGGAVIDTVKKVGASISDTTEESESTAETELPNDGIADEQAIAAVVTPQETAISTRNAIKIIYYLMAADGTIFHGEEEKFDSIGSELDPNFADNREQIIEECRAQLDKSIDSEDYYDLLRDGVEDALASSAQSPDAFITPKLLVWDLLTVAHSDESYDDAERRLIKYIVRKANIDRAVFLEMESSILTLMDIEKELAWIKTTDRPYLTIEAMVNELADRKNVIFESVKDLISL